MCKMCKMCKMCMCTTFKKCVCVCMFFCTNVWRESHVHTAYLHPVIRIRHTCIYSCVNIRTHAYIYVRMRICTHEMHTCILYTCMLSYARMHTQYLHPLIRKLHTCMHSAYIRTHECMQVYTLIDSCIHTQTTDLTRPLNSSSLSLSLPTTLFPPPP